MLPLPAQTRAALWRPPLTARKRSVAEQLRVLESRGYNTLVLPMLQDGGLVISPRDPVHGRRSRAFCDALLEAHARDAFSLWALIDPLSAGPPETGQLGRLARRRRDWLARNAEGHLMPLGEDTARPLFSWVNQDFRRFLGDILVGVAEALPITGILIDARSIPLPSEDPRRWFCCSYQSQLRVAESFGVDFDVLLEEGTLEEIERWQAWVFGEFRAMLEYLKGRVGEGRWDLGWKLLAPDLESRPPSRMPWTPCLHDGLLEELALERVPGKSGFMSAIESLDRLAGRPLAMLPVVRTEAEMREWSEHANRLPTPGFLVLEPELDVSFAPLPATGATWPKIGALEDNPLAAARALASYLADTLGDDHRVGRFYRRVRKYLDEYQPEPTSLVELRMRVGAIDERLAAGEVTLPEGKEHLLREMGLLTRLLTLIRTPPLAA